MTCFFLAIPPPFFYFTLFKKQYRPDLCPFSVDFIGFFYYLSTCTLYHSMCWEHQHDLTALFCGSYVLLAAESERSAILAGGAARAFSSSRRRRRTAAKPSCDPVLLRRRRSSPSIGEAGARTRRRRARRGQLRRQTDLTPADVEGRAPTEPRPRRSLRRFSPSPNRWPWPWPWLLRLCSGSVCCLQPKSQRDDLPAVDGSYECVKTISYL